MRKTLNLVLAAGLAASAFGSTAASAKKAGCENPDERIVVDKKGYEGEQAAGPVPGGAPVAYVSTYLLDLGSKKASDVTVTISWDHLSDYDLYFAYEVDGERSESTGTAGDQIGGDDPIETGTIEDVPNCAFLKIGALNFAGDPLEYVNLVVEVG